MKSFNVGVILSGFLFVLVIYGGIDWRAGFLLFSIGFLVTFPIMMYEERREIERKEKEAAERRRLAEQRAAEERKQHAEEQKRRSQQSKKKEQQVIMVSMAAENRSSYAHNSIQSSLPQNTGFNYNSFLVEKQKTIDDVLNEFDRHCKNQFGVTLDELSTIPDYSAFGIAANTPDIDMAEAHMFDDFEMF